jgi:hypothetical protein
MTLSRKLQLVLATALCTLAAVPAALAGGTAKQHTPAVHLKRAAVFSVSAAGRMVMDEPRNEPPFDLAVSRLAAQAWLHDRP